MRPQRQTPDRSDPQAHPSVMAIITLVIAGLLTIISVFAQSPDTIKVIIYPIGETKPDTIVAIINKPIIFTTNNKSKSK